MNLSEKLKWLLSFVVAIATFALYCLLLSPLLGCSSHRTASIVAVSDSSSTATHATEVAHTVVVADTSSHLLSADRLWLSFAADSMITPQGAIIYNPIISAGADNTVAKAGSSHYIASQSTASHTDSIASEASAHVEQQRASDSVAVTRPPNANSWLVIAPSVALALLLLWYRWRRR